MENEILALKPMRRILISDEIIEHIKNLIIDGHLKPGDKLPSEFRMAAQLNVGRSTVREALKVLTHLGFIELKNRERVISRSVQENSGVRDVVERFKNHRNVLQMIEFRKIVEPDIAGLAAVRSQRKDIDALQQDVEEMAEAEKKNNLKSFSRYDHEFHFHLAQSTGNQVLIDVIRGIQDNLATNQGLIIFRSKGIRPRSLEFHRRIYESIREGKESAARRHMQQHIQDIESEMYTILKEEEDPFRTPRD